MNNRRKLLVVLGAGALAAPLGVPFGISVAATGSADWATRSAGRKLARRLASGDPSDANVGGRHPRDKIGIWDPGGGYSLPYIDEGSMRFDIYPDRGIGDWYADLNHRYGANSVMYAQWQLWFSKEFINTVFKSWNGQYPGTKLAIFSYFNASSGGNKLVVQTMGARKHPFIYQYDNTGATRNLQVGINNGADFDQQPKEGVTPTCLYTRINQTPFEAPVPGCETLVAEKWTTFDLKVETGGAIPGANTWDAERWLWMTVDGVKKLVVHYGKKTHGYVGRNVGDYEAFWGTPYLTDGSTGHPMCTVRMREVIVDVNPIPSPSRIEVPSSSRQNQKALPSSVDKSRATDRR